MTPPSCLGFCDHTWMHVHPGDPGGSGLPPRIWMPRRWEGQCSLWMRGDWGCSEEVLWGLLGKKRLQEPETSISQDSSSASSPF